MHIVNLLDFLLPAPDVEIVESRLPKSFAVSRLFPPQAELASRASLAPAVPQGPGDALLEDLQDGRGRSNPGLADQQVEVFASRRSRPVQMDRLAAHTR